MKETRNKGGFIKSRVGYNGEIVQSSDLFQGPSSIFERTREWLSQPIRLL